MLALGAPELLLQAGILLQQAPVLGVQILQSDPHVPIHRLLVLGVQHHCSPPHTSGACVARDGVKGWWSALGEA